MRGLPLAFSVFGRRHAILFLENLIKIAFIVVSYSFCNFINTFPGSGQQIGSVSQADLLKICRVGQPGLTFNQAVEIVLLKVENIYKLL